MAFFEVVGVSEYVAVDITQTQFLILQQNSVFLQRTKDLLNVKVFQNDE